MVNMLHSFVLELKNKKGRFFFLQFLQRKVVPQYNDRHSGFSSSMSSFFVFISFCIYLFFAFDIYLLIFVKGGGLRVMLFRGELNNFHSFYTLIRV